MFDLFLYLKSICFEMVLLILPPQTIIYHLLFSFSNNRTLNADKVDFSKNTSVSFLENEIIKTVNVW